MKNLSSPPSSPIKRLHGIDLLKCLAMFFVVLQHALGHGGAGTSFEDSAGHMSQFVASWSMKMFILCAVNCFALASGYLGILAPYRLSRLIRLWFLVLFYSIGFLVIFLCVRPDLVTMKDVLANLFPVYRFTYWYFSAYAILFLMIPYLHTIIRSLNRTQAKWLCVAIFIVCSLLVTIFHAHWLSGSGYSVFWLACLYIVGACVRQFNLWSDVKHAGLWYGVSALVGIFLVVIFPWCWNQLPHVPQMTGFFLGRYTSPIICATGFFLFLACANMEMRNKLFIRIVSFLSPLSFAVYIIHQEPLVWNNLFGDLFLPFRTQAWYVMLLGVTGGVLAIYLLCSLLDFGREKVFRLLRINALADKVELFLSKLKNALLNKIPD